MPKHQRNRQTTGPCPGIATLTRHAEELLASALAPVETARNQRHILDSDRHSLQAQQRQALDPNNKRYHLAAGLPSSDHGGILVCARCYRSYFISVLSSDHGGILVCARCYRRYFISVLSSDHGGILVCARCYRSYFISVLAQRACHQVAKFNEQLRGALQFYHFCPKQFKPHSFPIGPATTAAAQGVSESQIRSLGRRSSDAFMKYIRCSHRVSALSRALA